MSAELKKLILQNAALYDAQMNDMKLQLYTQMLRNVPIEKCVEAFNHFALEKGRRHLPMPSDILHFLNPTRDPQIEARDAASRVIEAVSKFGYTNPQKAKDFIGELGWYGVERFGGWQYLCENTGTDLNVNTLFAQIRDICLAVATRHAQGYGDQAPSLQQPNPQIQKLLDLAKPKRLE